MNCPQSTESIGCVEYMCVGRDFLTSPIFFWVPSSYCEMNIDKKVKRISLPLLVRVYLWGVSFPPYCQVLRGSPFRMNLLTSCGRCTYFLFPHTTPVSLTEYIYNCRDLLLLGKSGKSEKGVNKDFLELKGNAAKKREPWGEGKKTGKTIILLEILFIYES